MKIDLMSGNMLSGRHKTRQIECLNVEYEKRHRQSETSLIDP